MLVSKQDILKKLAEVNVCLDGARRLMHHVLHPDQTLGSLGNATVHSLEQTKMILRMINDTVESIGDVMNRDETPEEVKEKAYAGLKYVSEDSKCPKCGYGLVNTSIKKHSPVGSYFTLDKKQNDLYKKYSYHVMERQCTGCNYFWYEKPLDVKDTDTKVCCVIPVGSPVRLVNNRYFINNVRTEEGNSLAITFNATTRFTLEEVDSLGLIIKTKIGEASINVRVHNENDIKRSIYTD